MLSGLFSPEVIDETLKILKSEFLLATWETLYVTIVATLFSIIIGLPLGVLLVAGDKNGVLPLPRVLMRIIGGIINLLRSVPFLILMIMVLKILLLLVIMILI